jgi:phage baseplate assembly protein W
MIKKDIAIDGLGDIKIGSYADSDNILQKDFSSVKGSNSIEQTVRIRLKTRLEEFFLHPEVGCELNEIIGKRNTKENAEKGRIFIYNAIKTESYIDESQIEVKAFPVDANKIVYSININNEEEVVFALELDLEEGTRRLV